MKILDSKSDLFQFFVKAAGDKQKALLLDYDGTLAPFRVKRDEALPYPGIREILESILNTGQTRLVIISGRGISELIPLLGLYSTPEIWGSHGWERLLPDGTYWLDEIGSKASSAFEQVDIWASEMGYPENWERKPVSRAFHWRGLDTEKIESLRARVLEKWAPLAQKTDLDIHPFDGGLELRVPGRDKGFAVRTILTEIDQDAAIAYLGDDLTDEDAFHALKGRGLSVLVRKELRPTEADLWLIPPEELLDFLRRWDALPEKD